MNFSKFFVAALISGTAVFAGSAANATPVLPSPIPNTVVPSALNCGCTTAAALVVDGPKFSAAIAQGNRTAKANAGVGTAYGEATSDLVRAPRPHSEGGGSSGNLD